MTKIILGIDEVGRGPWAGPLVVGAVILGENFKSFPEYDQLRDSKKIAKQKRRKLANFIQENALAYGLGWVEAAEIDKYGLGPALKLAARRATKQVLSQKIKFDSIIIDGTIDLLADTPLEEHVSLLPKADDLIKEVSAASIIAKVARDDYMTKIAEKYPEYGFESHVGYGTARHRAALEAHGICLEHRRSFRPIIRILEKLPTEKPQDKPGSIEAGFTTLMVDSRQEGPSTCEIPSKNVKIGRKNQKSGHIAEDFAARHLCHENHKIIAKNHKTAFYEIDLISTLGQKIYFTEVKYHQNPENGSPLELITTKKLEKMRFASEKFRQEHPEFHDFQPILAAAAVTGENFENIEWLELE